MQRNLYQVLGLKSNASYDEIRHAYHTLAHRYHPDKNGGVDIDGRFDGIARAYEVLGNSERRAKYDEGNPEVLREAEEFVYKPYNGKSPRWTGSQPIDLFDIESTFQGMVPYLNMSWSDLALVSALTEAYRTGRDGAWSILSTTGDEKYGVAEDYIYSVNVRGSVQQISRVADDWLTDAGRKRGYVSIKGNDGKVVEKDDLGTLLPAQYFMDKKIVGCHTPKHYIHLLIAYDSLAYHLARGEDPMALLAETADINYINGLRYKDGDRRIASFPKEGFEVSLRQARERLVEFYPFNTEGNRRSVER